MTSTKKTSGGQDVYRQRVSMAGVQVDGLSQEEILSALAYEVEPFSGIPAHEADVTFSQLDGGDESVRVFDVTVRRRKSASGGISAAKALRAAIAFSAVVFVAIAADFAVLSYRTGRLSSSVEARRPLDSSLRSIENKASSLGSEAVRLAETVSTVDNARNRIASARSRYFRLMGEIARKCGGRMVVKSFDSPEAFSVEMSASAVSVQACADALSELTRAASLAGWSASPGKMHSDESLSTVGFTCRFTAVPDAAGQKGGR